MMMTVDLLDTRWPIGHYMTVICCTDFLVAGICPLVILAAT